MDLSLLTLIDCVGEFRELSDMELRVISPTFGDLLDLKILWAISIFCFLTSILVILIVVFMMLNSW